MNFMVAFRSPMRKKKKSRLSLLLSCHCYSTSPKLYWFWHIWLVFFLLIYYLCRLAEKRAAIGYTYEDGIVAETETQSDKDEDNSENSESEEDEGIPDIGELMCVVWTFLMYLHPVTMGDLGPGAFLWRTVMFWCWCLILCTDVEVDVDELNQEQVLDINKMANSYGMSEGDFVR